MKAYGLPNKMKYNYIDNHPQKGLANWWEVELGNVEKKRDRQRAKKDIVKELIENQQNLDNEFADIVNEHFWELI